MHLHRTRGAGEGPDRQDHVSRDPVSPRGRERERGARGGRDAAAHRVPEADARVLFPLDAPWAVRRALDAVAPRLVLFSETELWPNFLRALAAREVPAIMVSGRMSARAFGRYRRWRRLFAPVL